MRIFFYSKNILSFDPSTKQWGYAGIFPYGSAGATVVVQKNRTITVLNGEVKPGLRTDMVYSGNIENSMSDWQALPSINSPDGVAGGFGGESQGYVIFAGGAGFDGSRNNYNHGKLYAHEGIAKYYSKNVNIYKSGKWVPATKLPYGIAYGVSVQWSDGLLMIGGEGSDGRAKTRSLYLTVNKGKVDIN